MCGNKFVENKRFQMVIAYNAIYTLHSPSDMYIATMGMARVSMYDKREWEKQTRSRFSC